MLKVNETFEDRFWEKVKKTNGCWKWTGSKKPNGYGQINSGGKFGKPVSAHVAVLYLHGQQIKKGFCVDHICKNRCCVNPAHLRIVTNQQNTIENSDSTAAKNSVKTQCPQGHKYGGYNLVRGSKGERRCRKCIQKYQRNWLRARETLKKLGEDV